MTDEQAPEEGFLPYPPEDDPESNAGEDVSDDWLYEDDDTPAGNVGISEDAGPSGTTSAETEQTHVQWNYLAPGGDPNGETER